MLTKENVMKQVIGYAKDDEALGVAFTGKACDGAPLGWLPVFRQDLLRSSVSQREKSTAVLSPSEWFDHKSGDKKHSTRN